MIMHSGPVRWAAPPGGPPGFCSSTGGADSLAASTADLRTVADLLDRSGDVASHTLIALAGAAADLPVTGAIASPGSAADIACQVGALTMGPSGLGMLVLKTEALARLLRLAATLYDDTEWLQRTTFAALEQALAPSRFVFELTGALINQGGRLLGSDRDVVPGTENFWQDGVTLLRLQLFGFAMPGTGLDSQVGALTLTGRAFGLFEDSRPLRVNQIPPASPSGAGPGDLGALADDVAGAYDDSPVQENILVHRVRQPDGSAAWVVSIPGTTQWSPVSTADPADAGANLASMAGMPLSLYPAITSCLSAAMRQAGVAPGKEPVMLVGHSQGGMVAARMAQDAGFVKKFGVREVVTFGSPVTGWDLPPGVNGLDIDNKGDVVARLDQQNSANAANRAQISCAEPQDPAVPFNIGQHEIATYSDRAHKYLGTDTTVAAARDFYGRTGGTFLGGQSTTYEFALSRPVDK